MLLNQTSVYGLRALAVLVNLAPGETLNAAELSARTDVPQQYLSKVMRKLVVARLVTARRGHGGGFALARAAREIHISDVFAALDQIPEGGCAFGNKACDQRNPCALHPIWSKMQACVQTWTQGCTLADAEFPAGERAGKNRRR